MIFFSFFGHRRMEFRPVVLTCLPTVRSGIPTVRVGVRPSGRRVKIRLHGGGNMASTLPVVSFGYAAVKAGGSRVRSTRILDALLAAPNLPPGIAAKTRRLSASLAAGKGDFAAARRHLRAAVRLDP